MTVTQRRLMAYAAVILWAAAIWLRFQHMQPWGSLCSNMASTATILASLWTVIGPVQEAYRLGVQAGQRERGDQEGREAVWRRRDSECSDSRVVRIR